MHTLGNKADSIAGDVVADPSHNGRDNGHGFLILLFVVGFVASMTLGWVIFPKLLYSKKDQPFNFNHALHLDEVSNGCESCHYIRDDGTFSGIPKIESCIVCHDEMIGESEDEYIFIEKYVKMDREVPWLIYSKQPDCVFFSHAAHLKGRERFDCVVCHGHIGESKVSKPYEYNRLTKYSRDIWGKNISGIKTNTWDRMKMDDCANCHYEFEHLHNSSVQTGRDACFVCHK